MIESLLQSDDFSDLDDLLSDAMEARAKAKSEAKAPRKVNNPKPIQPSPEMVDANRRAAEWNVPREWKPVAATAFFDRQTCSHCGSVALHYKGEYQHQHSKQANIDRWIKADPVSNANLPRESKVTDEYVPLCCECAGEHGWPL